MNVRTKLDTERLRHAFEEVFTQTEKTFGPEYAEFARQLLEMTDLSIELNAQLHNMDAKRLMHAYFATIAGLHLSVERLAKENTAAVCRNN